MLYAYIADVEEKSRDAFGLRQQAVTPELLASLLDYDRTAIKKEFDKGAYECGVCLDTKGGSKCHRMEHCGHVFCDDCLQDCYNNTIVTGSVEDVNCPAYNCGTENDSIQVRRIKKARMIAPSELLRIPIERPAVQRYVNIKRKKK